MVQSGEQKFFLNVKSTKNTRNLLTLVTHRSSTRPKVEMKPASSAYIDITSPSYNNCVFSFFLYKNLSVSNFAFHPPFYGQQKGPQLYLFQTLNRLPIVVL